jgi:class 3 adenylate cyclase
VRSASVSEWLAAVGLPQYARLFEENRVGLDVLPHLTEQDLKDLGIPLGDRKRLLVAVKSESAPASEVSPPPAPAVGELSLKAERRQLTVLFCDLVGSTELSARLDPEELRVLIAAYRNAASAVVERYGGHVAQHLGDGLMVYFGWPRADEDAAARAVSAALDIVVAVKGVAAPSPLQVRIGIATGAVVVGEADSQDGEAAKLAVGETPNVAARIRSSWPRPPSGWRPGRSTTRTWAAMR